MTPYERGREAFKRYSVSPVLKVPEPNPYQELTGNWADWEEGFSDAYDETLRHPDDLSQYI